MRSPGSAWETPAPVNLGHASHQPRRGIVEVGVKDSTDRVKSFELVDQAVKLQLSKDSDLSKIEECLKTALELDPGSLEALKQAALFYNAVSPHHQKARRYAIACRDHAAQIVFEMEQIVREKRPQEGARTKQPASGHIGGIIGPY